LAEGVGVVVRLLTCILQVLGLIPAGALAKAAPTLDTDMSRSDQTRLPDQARNKTNCSVPFDPPTLATSACSGNSRCRTGIWPEQTGLFPTRHSDIGKMVSRKMKSVLDKNSGYETLCSISRILTGESFSTLNIEELTASDLVHFKYAPIVSADVERSFSKYKNVLSDNRRSLTFENLRMLTVIYSNSQ
jgi:hypothetical protein